VSPPDLHILIVDDEPAIRDIMARVLVRAGFQVDVAEDGEHAWDAVGRRSYDLIITDEKMPRLTGAGLIDRLRRKGAMIPVLLMSGVAVSVETETGPPDGFIAKPFSFSSLLSEANRLLCPAAV
jgi:DNA-binding response OmpR family regulator